MTTSRFIFAVGAVALIGCAMGKSGGKGEAEQTGERFVLSNISSFDIGTCKLRSVELPAVTQETLIGALLVAQPTFQECLVDSAHRGPANETRVGVKATVSDEAVKYEVEGENLRAESKACIEATAAKLPVKPLEKGAAPVTAQFAFAHVAGTNPSVKFGANAPSDMVGKLRLLQPQWCDCYADLGTTPPPSMKAQLHFPAPSKEKDAPPVVPDVKVTSGTEPAAVKLASCLEAKIKAVQFSTPPTELQVPYTFLLLNSSASTESPDATPNFQFLQLDAIRGQRTADVAIALGGRTSAAVAYDAVVTKYKATKAFKLIKELREKCAGVIAADDKYIEALKGMLAIDTRMSTLIAAQTAKEAWAAADAQVKKHAAQSEADIVAAEKQRTVDQGACPKSKD